MTSAPKRVVDRQPRITSKRDAACARSMGTAERAGLGDERRNESAPARRRSSCEPHAPTNAERSMSPPASSTSVARGWRTTSDRASSPRCHGIRRGSCSSARSAPRTGKVASGGCSAVVPGAALPTLPGSHRPGFSARTNAGTRSARGPSSRSSIESTTVGCRRAVRAYEDRPLVTPRRRSRGSGTAGCPPATSR